MISYRFKFNLKRKRDTENHVNRAAKNKLVLTKIWVYNLNTWSTVALNVYYKAKLSTNSSCKQEIVLKLSHPLDPQEQIMISFSLNLEPGVANKRPWHDCPNMWSYLRSNMVKNSNYRGLHRIMNLQWRQPRFLAWFIGNNIHLQYWSLRFIMQL